MNKNEWLTIGEVAKRAGISVATVRFYEEKELIHSIRTDGNQRRYQRLILRKIAIIKIAQQVGITLNDVKSAFEVLPKNKGATKKDWQKMSKIWQQKLNEKIESLQQLQEQLDQCICCGCLSLKQCPLRNPNDQMAQYSKGSNFDEISVVSLESE